MAGFHDEKGCNTGQSPVQPSRLSAPGVATYFPPALLWLAMCTNHVCASVSAAVPVAPAGLSTGPNSSDVPAPDSKAMLFIGCFEYSYDSIPDEYPARSMTPAPASAAAGSTYRLGEQTLSWQA